MPEGTIVPLVSKEVFDEVQLILKDNKSFSARNNRHPDIGLLRGGLCKCAICGYTMHIQVWQPHIHRNHLYTCQASRLRSSLERHTVSINIPEVDSAAWEVALEFILDPLKMDKHIESLELYRNSPDEEAVMEKRLDEVKKKFNNLYKALEQAADNDVIVTLTRRMKELEKEKRDLESLAFEIQAEEEIKEAMREEVKRFQEWASKVAN